MTDIVQNTILPFVEHFRSYAAWFAFFAAFGETLIGFGFFIPGSTMLLFLGLLAGQGYLDIKTVLVFGIAGAYMGDIVNYHLGRKYGIALLKKPWVHLSDNMIEAAHRFLNSHGAKSVFFARFLPGMKESVPFFAGSLGMRMDKFLIWDFFGAVGWSLEFIGIGYLFSASLSLAQIWLSRTLTVVAFLMSLLIILFLLKRFMIRNAPIAKSIALSLWKAFLNNRYIKEFLVSHPKFTSFLKNRFDKTTFYGLPMTVFILVFLYVLALFGGVVEDLLNKDSIIYVDRILANLILQWRTPELTIFFTWITYLGRGETILLFSLAAALILFFYKKYNELFAICFSLIGSILFVYVSKLLFHRPRPQTALYFEQSYSFPSAHALVSISFYGFLAYIAIRQIKSTKAKVNILFAAILLALMIGLSRIYLGEHYLSDVYGGYLLGTLWALTAAVILEWMTFKKRYVSLKPMPYAKILSLITVFVSGTIFVVLGLFHPYKPALRHDVSIKKIEKITDLFSDKNSRFTRNIIGAESIPVTLAIVVDKKRDLCKAAKREGWISTHKRRSIDFPLFWNYKLPLCSFYKKSKNRIYLLKIWDSQATLNGKRVYVASTDAIKSFRWGIYPVFTNDIGEARAFAIEMFKKQFSLHKSYMVLTGAPVIKERIFKQPYFSDAKVYVVEID